MATQTQSATQKQKQKLADFAQERWIGSDLTDAGPLVLAYQVGRLVNALGWAMARAALRDDVRGHVEFLIGRLVELGPLVDSASIEAELSTARRRWFESLEGEGHAEWSEQVAEAPETWSAGAWDGSGKFADTFAATFDGAQRCAIQLGRVIDRGIRPLPTDERSLTAAQRKTLLTLIGASSAEVGELKRLIAPSLRLGEVRGLCRLLKIGDAVAVVDAVGTTEVTAADAAVRSALSKARQPKRCADRTNLAGQASAHSAGGSVPTLECRATEDYTSVVWHGTQYVFANGQQADCVKELWECWERRLLSVGQGTIAERIGAEPEHFELAKVFRRKGKRHPAWGTMIRSATKGCFGLYPPKSL